MEKLFCCTACGVQGETKCECGKGYKFMPAAEAMALRKREAERLYKDGMTMEKIGEALGVSQMTISRDLGNSNIVLELKPAKTASNPKGAGRPKGNASQRKKSPSPKQDKVQDAVEALVRDGKPVNRKKVGDQYGVGQHAVQLAVAYAEGKLEAEGEIVPERDLSKSAQEKLASAMRQYQKTLDATFEQRVQGEIKKRVEEMCLPGLRERQKDAERITKARKHGIFKQAEYNAILRCVHPDLSPTTEEKNEAFRLLHENRIVLLSNADDPRKYPELPTIAEFMRG